MSSNAGSTKLVIAINTGNSLVVRAAILRITGALPEDAEVTLDSAGNVTSMTVYADFARLHEVTTALINLSGISGVNTPELSVLAPAARPNIDLMAQKIDVATGEILITQSDVSAMGLAKAGRADAVAAANATDLASALTLVNELKAKLDSMNA